MCRVVRRRRGVYLQISGTYRSMHIFTVLISHMEKERQKRLQPRASHTLTDVPGGGARTDPGTTSAKNAPGAPQLPAKLLPMLHTAP